MMSSDAEFWLVLPAFTAGLLMGRLYFSLLLRSVQQFVDGARLPRTAVLAVARFLLAVGGFWLIAQAGALALLAALFGFIAARFWLRCRVNDSSEVS